MKFNLYYKDIKYVNILMFNQNLNTSYLEQ